MIQISQPFQNFVDANGLPLDNGFVYIGTANQNPETNPIAVYWDAALTIPAAQPIRTINGYLSRNGSPARLYANASIYSITVRDQNRVISITALDASTLDNLRADLAAPTGAGLSGFDGTLNYAVGTIGALLHSTINVTAFPWLVKGDGATDNSAALNAISAVLFDGQAIYVPAGDYIADTAAWLIRGKNRIHIYGDGKATRLRVSGQTDANAVKLDFHTTMAIDQCTQVTIQDMVIESKGANYGNTDAYGGLAGGDDRSNAIINYGGSALAVLRSSGVVLRNLDARRCGSVGVVYLSSCEDVVVENCFASARSLGYAGFAADNWAHSTIMTKRTYKFINCRSSKEDATYGSKGAIVLEGDQVTGRLLNVEIVGGVFEDTAIGGTSPTFGAAIVANDVRLVISGVVTKNCYIGVHWTKRGGAVDFSWLLVDGCTFLNNAVAGAFVNIATATGGSNVEFSGTTIVTDTTSVWAALSATYPEVSDSSGITVGGFVQGSIAVNGCNISGGQKGIYAIDNAKFVVSGGNISGIDAAIRTYGGGILKVNGAILAVTSGDRVIGRSTLNLAGTASYSLYTYVNNNTLECVADTATDYPVALAGNSALFVETQIRNNATPKGTISASKGSATLYDVDIPAPWTPVVAGSGTAGTYEQAATTRCTYIKIGKQVTVNGYIVMAAAVTGGGTANLTITGLPFPKRAESAAFGMASFSGVDYSVGKQVAVYFGTTAASSVLNFWETSDAAAVSLVPVSGVGVNDIIAFSITYETA